MRKVEPGISWVWYFTDTDEDAKNWFEELTGNKPKYDWVAFKDRRGLFGFRLRK